LNRIISATARNRLRATQKNTEMVVTDIVDAAIPRIMKNAAVGQLIRSEQNIQKLMFDSIKQIHKIALKNNATMKKNVSQF